MSEKSAQRGWIDAVIFDLVRQLRWSFLPPLMVYFAFGFSGLTGIVGMFFVKEYLDLTPAELAALAFWAGLPWALKMPLGHLVDIIWPWKWLLVWLGAALVAASFLIMYLVIAEREMMEAVLPITSWYIASFLIAPCGLVIQDAVADAMSVEVVPKVDDGGRPLDDEELKAQHTTMQTLGRFAVVAGTVAIGAMNIYMFAGIETLDAQAKADIYAKIYLFALFIPLLSVSGVVLAAMQKRMILRGMSAKGLSPGDVDALFEGPEERTVPNPWYFIGGGVFVALTLLIGLGQVPYGQEIIFAGSMLVVGFLMRQLIAALDPAQARTLIGTAVIIFVFRAVPLPGDGAMWFNIDELGFDQQFLSVLSLIGSVLALVGMVVLRPLMAHLSIVYIVVLLTITSGILLLPSIGLYYGIQNITGPLTAGIVDARFIAIIDTAAESPLAQVAMIPMLAWIARNAPPDLKATFFAVMASFTNLAMSASSLGTKYLNEVYTITREVRDTATGVVTVQADYSQLGWLLITVGGITVGAPLLVVWVVQRSAFRSRD